MQIAVWIFAERRRVSQHVGSWCAGLFETAWRDLGTSNALNPETCPSCIQKLVNCEMYNLFGHHWVVLAIGNPCGQRSLTSRGEHLC